MLLFRISWWSKHFLCCCFVLPNAGVGPCADDLRRLRRLLYILPVVESFGEAELWTSLENNLASLGYQNSVAIEVSNKAGDVD